MRNLTSTVDLAFVSHIPLDVASGGGLYSRSIFDLLERVWPAGSVEFVGPRTTINSSRLACLGWGFLTLQPSKAVFAARSGAIKALSQAAPNQYGVVCLNSPDVLPLVDKHISKARQILVCHNIESDLFMQKILRLPALAHSLLLRDQKRYAELEERAFERASLIIAISASDVETIRSKHPSSHVVHIPPAMNYQERSISRTISGTDVRMGFVGRMQWWPNRDAVEWLRRNLAPLPKGREIHFYGVGSEKLTNTKVGFYGHGFVEDPETLWSRIDIALCPVKSGGGVNIKLVEAFARGVPVLTTSFGTRGLGLELSDRPGLRIIDSEEDWRTFIASDQILELARETPDPTIANYFKAEAHVKRLSIALKKPRFYHEPPLFFSYHRRLQRGNRF